eukprot:5546765-Prymnesium_polylepis.1
MVNPCLDPTPWGTSAPPEPPSESLANMISDTPTRTRPRVTESWCFTSSSSRRPSWGLTCPASSTVRGAPGVSRSSLAGRLGAAPTRRAPGATRSPAMRGGKAEHPRRRQPKYRASGIMP